MGRDPWRIRDACEGTVIFGGTGSGKTSGSGRALARSFLAAGFGGLVLCAKPGEPELWRGYAEESGRADDLAMFGTEEPWSFNFMHYESLRSGAAAGLTENLVNLFMEVSSIGSGDARSRGGDPFWERAMRSLVRNCVDVLAMADEPVSLHAMFDVIRGAPPDAASLTSEVWKAKSPCWRILEAARERATGTAWEVDCKEVARLLARPLPHARGEDPGEHCCDVLDPRRGPHARQDEGALLRGHDALPGGRHAGADRCRGPSG